MSDDESGGSDGPGGGDELGSGDAPGSVDGDSTPRDPSDYDPVAFLENAVQVPSHEDETDMRELLVATLRRYGVEPSVDDTGNVLARREPDSPAEGPPSDGPHVVLNTHIDTVIPHVAFERDRNATVEGEEGVDIIRGRGSCDAKGPLAVLLGAFLNADVGRGRLTLAISPDEETLSLGAAALTGRLDGTTDELDGDLYIVGEPTGLDVCTAAKGRFGGSVELTGENAHAAEFAGVNAIAAAEDALRVIREFDDERDDHPQLGSPKLTPTIIEGGGAKNQIPDHCSITIDRRSVPPESADAFREELDRDVREAVNPEVGVAVELAERDSPFLEAFATDPDHRLATTLAEAVDATRPGKKGGGTGANGVAIPGRGGARRPFSAATEASYFSPAPTVVFGPGDLADADGAVAHSEREYVRVREVTWATRAATVALSTLLG